MKLVPDGCGTLAALRRPVIYTPLASCVTVGKRYTVGKLCGSWQAVAVGDLYTICELCGSWQAVYRWQGSVAASKLSRTGCLEVPLISACWYLPPPTS
jgi:hypothetical protein